MAEETTDNWPTIPKSLIDKLKEDYKAKIYDTTKSFEDNLIYSGMVKLAQLLEQEYNIQNELI